MLSLMSFRLIRIVSASTLTTLPATGEITHDRESIATLLSIPVPTIGAFGYISGTACRCILDPINALFASSCSKKGINAAATLKIWFGETSM